MSSTSTLPTTSPPKIKPFHDSRVSHRSAHLNGHTYGYLFTASSANQAKRGTIILVHGFPDISFAWRNQIPFLSSMGYDIIAVDCMGYGRSDSPLHDLSKYTFSRFADDIAELCRQLGLERIILGGHDWGAPLVYRTVLKHPQLISAFFTVCVPYNEPINDFTPLPKLVATRLPNFGYQVQNGSGLVEEHVRSPTEIRQFLAVMYGDRTKSGKLPFSAERGIDFAGMRDMDVSGGTKLLSKEELDYYVQEYSRHGVNGPLNYYRTQELNWWDEQQLYFENGKPKKDLRLHQPSLFISAKKDLAVRPWMTKRHLENVLNCTRVDIDAGHWVLWEQSEKVNRALGEWFVSVVWKGEAKAQGTVSKL